MFVIELVYKAGLDQIDAHMRAHMRFLNAHYAPADSSSPAARCLATAASSSPPAARARRWKPLRGRIRSSIAGLADVRVIEFRASQRAPDINALIASRNPLH
jgi:hypothetical protein